MPLPAIEAIPCLARLNSGGLFQQLCRYLAVAIFALVVDFSLLVASVEWCGAPVAMAAAVGFCGGLGVNYALSIRWVFGARSTMHWRLELLIFAGIGWVGFAITELLLLVGSALAADYRLTKLVAVAVVFFWNFGLRRLLLVKWPRSGELVDDRSTIAFSDNFVPLPRSATES